LARISVDIPPAADAAFEVNVSKMRVTIPEALRGELRAIAATASAQAQATYRQRGDTRTTAPPRPGQGRGADPTGGDHGAADDPERVDVGTVIGILRRELGDLPDLLARVVA